LRYHEDVGEDDGGVNEALVAFDGLEGERGGDFGATAALEKVMLPFRFVVLGQVTTGCVM
jgi:hypothetical protein